MVKSLIGPLSFDVLATAFIYGTSALAYNALDSALTFSLWFIVSCCAFNVSFDVVKAPCIESLDTSPPFNLSDVLESFFASSAFPWASAIIDCASRTSPRASDKSTKSFSWIAEISPDDSFLSSPPPSGFLKFPNDWASVKLEKPRPSNRNVT